MIRTLLVLLVLVALFARAEKEIEQCNQKEIELRVSHEECSTATSFELSTRKDRDAREKEYNKAVSEYDYAYGRWQVASKEELAAKTAHHTDIAVLTSIRTTEEQLCNKLVRNVENGTPCAHLLQRARENNRLHLCREAKKTLEVAIKREAASKLVHERLHKISMDKKAAKIALLRLRDEAFERFKSAKAVWTMRHSTQTSTCTRYNSLKIIFHGRSVTRTTRKCKKTNECVSFRTKCVEEKLHKICSSFVFKSTCAKTVNSVCRSYRTSFHCTRYRDVKNCVRVALSCTARKEKQICARVFRRSRIAGPSSCSANEQLAFRKEGSTLVRFCKKRENDNRREVVCQSTFDPYILTFKGQGFPMSSEGDYELYASHDGSVEVHTRQTLYPSDAATVNSKIAVLVNGADLVTYECKAKLFTVNGVSMKAQNLQLKHGGSVKTSSSTIDFFAPNGDKILARLSGNGASCWINTYVYSRNTNGGGLCYAEAKDADKYRITGLFKHFELPHESRSAIAGAQDQIKQAIPAAVRASARSACNIPKLPNQLKKQCEEDWLLSNDNFKNTVIRGYEQMINDEIRGHFDNSNFF